LVYLDIVLLEKIICDANINQRGNIFYKSVQILAFVDDIDIISRSPKSLQEATLALDRAARRMGLEINQAKTKYMICGTKKKYVENVFKVKHMTFERVNSFVYLLTPWSRVLLEKLASLQLVKKFPVFYGTRRFLTALTSARHLSLS
jgi:hypothetical protein